MRRTFNVVVTLLLGTTAIVAQGASSEPQTTQTLIAEIRQLRQDLYTTAATIQRVQIAVYRHQAQTALLERAKQRLDQARQICEAAERQQRATARQVEQAEARKRNAQDALEKAAAEAELGDIKDSAELWTSQKQGCEGEQVDAEAQLRLEQAKMNELQDRLDQLDRFLARSNAK